MLLLRSVSLIRRSLLLAVVFSLLIPALTLATATAIAHTLVLPTAQIWTLVIGALVPLVTYVLNHVGPWVTEPVKAGVLVIVAAVTTALYTALATNVIGLNTPTLELVLSGVVAALAAHHWLWKPSGISALLGAGSNAQPVVSSSPGPAAPLAQSHPSRTRDRTGRFT